MELEKAVSFGQNKTNFECLLLKYIQTNLRWLAVNINLPLVVSTAKLTPNIIVCIHLDLISISWIPTFWEIIHLKDRVWYQTENVESSGFYKSIHWEGYWCKIWNIRKNEEYAGCHPYIS